MAGLPAPFERTKLVTVVSCLNGLQIFSDVFRNVQQLSVTAMMMLVFRLRVDRFWSCRKSCPSRTCEIADTCEFQGVHGLMDPEEKGKRQRKKEFDRSQIWCLATFSGHKVVILFNVHIEHTACRPGCLACPATYHMLLPI